MGRVKILSVKVANQIAAGEVVERPASVCKELLENSLDAGATRIRIEIQSGGRCLIRVADNGHGMLLDDALVAIERHGTSKLRELGDLLAIPTLGFRGEALPSIGSVSRLLLETQYTGEETGAIVEINGGKIADVREEALNPGTTVTVRNLFYNVPARRKFLRTEQTELSHIVQLVTHYSLAHCDKSFTLSNEHSTLLNVTPVETLRERIYQIFGGDTLDELVEMAPVERRLQVAGSPVPPTLAVRAYREGRPETTEHEFRLRGFFSEPQVHKRSRNSVFIFVNNRLIRDKVILKAISSAYYNFMPSGSFPFALMFLDLSPEEVDVNVHPSKTEVRFRHQSFVYDFVRDSIRACLEKSKPASQLPPPQTVVGAADDAPQSETVVTDERPAPDEAFTLRPDAPPPARFDFNSDDVIEVSGASGFAEAPAAITPAISFEADRAAGYSTHSRAPLVDRHPDSLGDLSDLRLLGQIKESFIVAAGPDGLWIIDQHVAHERILYERVMAERMSGQVEVQRLLMPIVLTLTPDQQITFTEIESEFRANGFELEPFGKRTIAVKAAPAALTPHEVETLVHEILETPQREMRELSLDDLRRHMAATIACHAAIKINMPLDKEKMRWLLDSLAKTDCPMACPHGRPIALKYGMRDILKAFHRV
jgi:DNA mismatch repair protein MutL